MNMRNILVCIKRTKQERGMHDENRFTRSITLADPGFDLRGGVDFVNGGGG